MPLAPHRIAHFAETDSTNAEAQRLAAAGERGPLWIWADRQTQGRGRLGRSWVSERGNLYATFLFTIPGGPVLASQVSFVAALAVRDTAETLLSSRGFDPSPPPLGGGKGSRNEALALKWPNDVLLDGAKFSGILPEAIAGAGHTTLALGCGINLAHAPIGTSYPVAHLSAYGATADPAEALEQLAAALDRRLSAWNEGRGFGAIRQAWLAHAFGLGQPMQAADVSGIFSGIAEDGALILTLPSGAARTIHAGEVRLAARVRHEAAL